ncbi:MAG: hypothetical protein V1872_08250 [bacterium]
MLINRNKYLAAIIFAIIFLSFFLGGNSISIAVSTQEGVYLLKDVKFIQKIGPVIDGAVEFFMPSDIAIDQINKRIYIADTGNNRIQVFSEEGILEWGNNFLKRPKKIALDHNGNLYVTDTGNNQIKVFDSAGDCINTFGKDILHSPEGIAINDASGAIYVADTMAEVGNGRIQVFDSKGTVMPFTFQDNGSEMVFGTGSPKGITVDSEGKIYVVDMCFKKGVWYDRLLKFDSTGKLEMLVDENNLNNPSDVAIDEQTGNIYVTDTQNCRIQLFDPDGKPLSKWGGKVDDKELLIPGNLNLPEGMVINEGDIYVVDTGNNRIQVFDSTLFSSHDAFQDKWGVFGNGEFDKPFGVAVDEDNNIYVLDSKYYIRKFDSDWNFVGVIGDGVGIDNTPIDMAIGEDNSIYVMHSERDIRRFNRDNGESIEVIKVISDEDIKTLEYLENIKEYYFNKLSKQAVEPITKNTFVIDDISHSIQVFDPKNQKNIGTLGTYGEGDSQFKFPADIAIDQRGLIYVADRDNNCIKVFEIAWEKNLPPVPPVDNNPISCGNNCCSCYYPDYCWCHYPWCNCNCWPSCPSCSIVCSPLWKISTWPTLDNQGDNCSLSFGNSGAFSSLLGNNWSSSSQAWDFGTSTNWLGMGTK